MTVSRVCGVAAAALILAGTPVTTIAGPNDATVPVQVALKVGEQPYRFGGEAICQHAPQATIYDAPAALWSFRHVEPARSLNLAFWRVQAQGDMITLGLTLSGADHRVSTVKIGQKGDVRGSGRATFTASGAGGTFSLDLVARDGTPIKGTISCCRFTPIVEEGGGD
jgi:hypothetical protein